MRIKNILKVLSLIFLFAMIGWMVYLTVKHYKIHQGIKENPVYIQAQITRIYSVRRSDYCDYAYTAEGEIYFGDGLYYSTYGSVGDSIPVVFNRTNPKLSWTLEAFESYSIYKIIGIFLVSGVLMWLRLRKD